MYLVTAVEPVFKTHAGQCDNGTCLNAADNLTYHDLEECKPENFSCPDCPNAMCLFTYYKVKEWVISMTFYNLFAVLWTMAFVGAFSDLVLAGSFTTWYFTMNKAKLPKFVLVRSVVRNVSYHLGTAAFGSFVLAVVQFVRCVLEYIDQRLKDKTNPIVKAFLFMFKCCLYCLEKCIRFLNKNAYIVTSIKGYNFCKAAREAFILLVKNFIRAAVLTRVTDYVICVSKLAIMGVTVCISYAILSYEKVYCRSL